MPHVILCDPPARFTRAPSSEAPADDDGAESPSTSAVFYDDANEWVITHEETATGDDGTTGATSRLRCHPLPQGLARTAVSAPSAPSISAVSVPVPPGAVLDARVSPQWKSSRDRLDFTTSPRLVAVKRSDVIIDVYPCDASDGRSARYELRRVGERILAFFWSRAPGVDLVVVTTRGLEQFACLGCWETSADSSGDGVFVPGSGDAGEPPSVPTPPIALALVGEKRMKGETPVGWCVYDSVSQLVALASGPGHARLTAWQFATSGALKLPRFELPPTHASPRSPPMSPGAGADALRAEDVRLFSLYQRVFLARVDRRNGELVMYRVHRDALVRAHVVNLSPLLMYTEGALPEGVALDVNVVDNVLCVHALGSGTVSVIDVAGHRDVSAGRSRGEEVRALTAPMRLGCVRGSSECPSELRVLAPDVVMDTRAGVAWKLGLDLGAIAEGAGLEGADLVSFLQRRSQGPWVPPNDAMFEEAGMPLEASTAMTLTRHGATTPPFSPPFSPPTSPPPRGRRDVVVASEKADRDARDDAGSPKALTLDAMRRALHRGDSLDSLRSLFAAACGSYVEARSRGAAMRAGARFRASFGSVGALNISGIDEDTDGGYGAYAPPRTAVSAPSAAEVPTTPRRSMRVSSTPRLDPESNVDSAPSIDRNANAFRSTVPPSSPAVSPADVYSTVFRPHVDALIHTPHVRGDRGRRRSLRTARAAVVEYLLAAEQAGMNACSDSFGDGAVTGTAMCARLCVSASFALGDARRARVWGSLLVGSDEITGGTKDGASKGDPSSSAAEFLRSEAAAKCPPNGIDECDADVVAGDMERRGRGTAAVDAAVTTLVSTDVPGALRMADRKLATLSPTVPSLVDCMDALAGDPVRLAAAHRWFEARDPGIRESPLVAKYRAAFDPDGEEDGDEEPDEEEAPAA